MNRTFGCRHVGAVALTDVATVFSAGAVPASPARVREARAANKRYQATIPGAREAFENAIGG